MKLILLSIAVIGSALSAQQCGQPAIAPYDELIVGGKHARPGSWPWQALMCVPNAEGGCDLDCGGSIINDQWILSAAHCIADGDIEQTVFKLGAYDQKKENEDGVQTMRIAEIHPHPNYTNPTPFSNDIGLFKLREKITFGKTVQPICLPRDDANLVFEGSVATVTGWGAIKENGSDSELLRQVKMPIHKQETCLKDYTTAWFDASNQLCAGGDGVDSCQGDSGGPMVVKDKESNRWFQPGVVSFGNGCARKEFLGIYSRVAVACDWLKSVVGEEVCV